MACGYAMTGKRASWFPIPPSRIVSLTCESIRLSFELVNDLTITLGPCGHQADAA